MLTSSLSLLRLLNLAPRGEKGSTQGHGQACACLLEGRWSLLSVAMAVQDLHRPPTTHTLTPFPLPPPSTATDILRVT